MAKGKTFNLYTQVETELENLVKKGGEEKDAYQNMLSKFRTLMSKIMYYFDIDGAVYELKKEELIIFFKDKRDVEDASRSLKLIISSVGQTKAIKVFDEGNENVAHFDNYRPPVNVFSFIHSLAYRSEKEILFRNRADVNEKVEKKTHSSVRPTISGNLLDELNAISCLLKKIEDDVFEELKIKVVKTYVKDKGKNGILYIGFEGDRFKNGVFEKLDLSKVKEAFKEVLKKNKNKFFSAIEPMEEVSLPYGTY